MFLQGCYLFKAIWHFHLILCYCCWSDSSCFSFGKLVWISSQKFVPFCLLSTPKPRRVLMQFLWTLCTKDPLHGWLQPWNHHGVPSSVLSTGKASGLAWRPERKWSPPHTPQGKSLRLLWRRPGMTWEPQPSLAGGWETLPAPVGTEPPQAPFQRGICARKRV